MNQIKLGLKVIFGGARISPGKGFNDENEVREVMDVLSSHGIDTIDTAPIYGTSEVILGRAGAASRFLIDTKVPGGFSVGSLRQEELEKSLGKSLHDLKTAQINVFYLHSPDISVPIEEALETVHNLHIKGLFSKFGLSNYLAEDVEKIYVHCQSHGYILPTIYQGNYNPIARRQEEVLFPTLRKLGISFYAYSPIAGGFLSKSKEQLMDGGSGRFREGSTYWDLYVNPSNLDALVTWQAIATVAGCDRAELAYRWVSFNSGLANEFGDGIVVGAYGIAQFKETLSWLEKGPLDAATVAKIDQIWIQVKDTAPLDNFNG